jgi:hypothetical protein
MGTKPYSVPSQDNLFFKFCVVATSDFMKLQLVYNIDIADSITVYIVDYYAGSNFPFKSF